MRYYEGHESVYRKAKEKGCHCWDEYLGQADHFEAFSLKGLLEKGLARSTFSCANPSALSIGCGTGPGCCFLAAKGFQVKGIDVSATAISMAEKESKSRGLDIAFGVADVCRDCLGEAIYDLVVDEHCLHCIVDCEERQRALANIRNALKPDGYFWLETMLACPATRFGEDMLFDEDGILWVKIAQRGSFDLEKTVHGETYVANRRVYRHTDPLKQELEAAGWALLWSENLPSEQEHAPGVFQAICRSARGRRST